MPYYVHGVSVGGGKAEYWGVCAEKDTKKIIERLNHEDRHKSDFAIFDALFPYTPGNTAEEETQKQRARMYRDFLNHVETLNKDNEQKALAAVFAEQRMQT